MEKKLASSTGFDHCRMSKALDFGETTQQIAPVSNYHEIMLKKLLCATLVICSVPFHPAVADEEETSIGLILDCSASMWNKLEDGRYRIDAAKEVLVDFLSNTLARDGLNIGLRIYGSKVHFSREGACQDSALFVPVDGFERDELIAAVRNARAIGATPLARSLELAIADFTKAGVRRLIICTDGEESCGGDVKAALEALKAAGVDVDVRVIGIGLPEAAAKRFEAMGVAVDNVHTAGRLAEALASATETVIEPAPEPSLQKVTIKLVKDGAPLAGHSVEFSGSLGGEKILLTPGDEGVFHGDAAPGSYVAAVSPAEATFEALAVTRDSPAEFLLDLTKAPAVMIEATPSEVIGGSNIVAKFSGAFGIKEEWIGFILEGDEKARPQFWVESNGEREGELSIPVPVIEGTYTLGFFTRFQGQEVLAGQSNQITVKAPEITLTVPNEVSASSMFQVEWAGPDVHGAWIGYAKAETEDRDYIRYQSKPVQGEPIEFAAPGELGDYEVRYYASSSSAAISRAPFKVVEAELAVAAPDEAMAGSRISIDWKAPIATGVYITIVPADAEVGSWADYASTASADNPMILNTPRVAGKAEIRVHTEIDNKTLLRRPITLTEAKAELIAPDQVKAGEAFEVQWTGPGGSGDYITLATPDAADSDYYSYFSSQDPTQEQAFTAPPESGPYEIRYVTRDSKVLVKRPIKVE